MYQYILKSLKVGFWILAPLLFISNAEVVVPAELVDNAGGNYYFSAEGAKEGSLQGKVLFGTSTESNNEGASLSSLSLEFFNQEATDPHSIKILISRRNQLQPFKIGKYKVTENIEGFLNSFEGVFGYVNMNALSERPFFSNKGSVIVRQHTKNDLRGTINVAFVGDNGERMLIKGDFHAVRGH